MVGLSLLIVDDEEMLVDSLARYFTRKGFVVTKALGVEEGRSLIKSQDFQILLTDMRMPDGLGSELIKLQRNKHESSIIICATGFSEEDTQQILDHGANFVVGKPFEKNELLKKIQEFLIK
ncbi:MAG: response regulator [Halobacteriovoraceae bacterium]|nr:response regulator [Halobacteriovoraceae bacterium]